MQRQFNWAVSQVTAGRTVLVYEGVCARSAKHVKAVDRLTMRGDDMYVDGICARGMTIALKGGRG